MAVLPARLPYFDHASDPGSLRNYLNIIIRALNAILEFIVEGAPVSLTTITVAQSPYLIDGSENVILVDASGGAVALVYPLALGGPGATYRMQVMKIDPSANPANIYQVSVLDANLRDQILAPAILGAASGRWLVCDGTNVWSQNA